MGRRLLIWTAALLGAALPAAAQDETPPVAVALADGSRLVGRIVEEDAEALTIATESGLRVRIERAKVVSIERVLPRAARGDPHDSRLMFAPSGRPLRRGDGYFSDHYVVFPGVAYGLTDHVGVGGGVSIVPGVGLDEQLFYFAPQVGARFSDRFAATAGALYARGGEGFAAAIVFGVAALGSSDRSLSVGIGLGGARDGDGEDFRWRDEPILMFGGKLRLSNNLALVSENWIFVGSPASEQPFGLALRFFGDRLSADVGVILVGEVLEEGFPVPWLSFSYRFGKANGRAAR
jgi:uncharacterized membrane protein